MRKGWTARSDTLRILSLREVASGPVMGWATVVFSITQPTQPPAPVLPPDVVHRTFTLAGTGGALGAEVSAAHVEQISEAALALAANDRLLMGSPTGLRFAPASALIVMLATGTSVVDAVAVLARVRPSSRPDPSLVRQAEQTFGVDLSSPLTSAGMMHR